VNETQSQGAMNRRSVIIASNRGPVTFHRDANGELTFQRGSGGLVTALTGLIGDVNASWISNAISKEDVEWHEGNVPLTQDEDLLHLKFVLTDEQSYDGYYNVISNPLLWFLQHSMWNVPYAPVIDRDTWKAWENGYVAVNKLFSKAIIEQLAVTPKPVLVMLQDYHLYLVAHYLRTTIPPQERPTITHFTNSRSTRFPNQYRCPEFLENLPNLPSTCKCELQTPAYLVSQSCDLCQKFSDFN
jgi:trehalose 6-phosphate synthase